MKINKFAPVLVASILAFSLTFVGNSQAYAAACSTKDINIFDDPTQNGEGSTDLRWAYFNVAWVGDKSYVSSVFEIVDSWKVATKNKKLKTAIVKFENAFEKYADSGKFLNRIPEVQNAYNSIETIIKYKRC